MKRLLILLIAFGSTSCGVNVFDFIDTPNSEVQRLDQCIAFFDQDKLTEARDCYATLANGDDKYVNQAFLIMDEVGFSMEGVMSAIGAAGSGGKILTKLANLMTPYATSHTKREAMWGAFEKTLHIKDQQKRGLVRLLSSTALLSMMLAELSIGGYAGVLEKTDYVTSPSSCDDYADYTACGLASGTNCAGSNPEFTSGSSVDFDDGAASVSAGFPTMAMMVAAVVEMDQALSDRELGASGKFSSGLSTVATVLSSRAISTQAEQFCFLYSLIVNDIGKDP